MTPLAAERKLLQSKQMFQLRWVIICAEHDPTPITKGVGKTEAYALAKGGHDSAFIHNRFRTVIYDAEELSTYELAAGKILQKISGALRNLQE